MEAYRLSCLRCFYFFYKNGFVKVSLFYFLTFFIFDLAKLFKLIVHVRTVKLQSSGNLPSQSTEMMQNRISLNMNQFEYESRHSPSDSEEVVAPSQTIGLLDNCFIWF